MPQSRACPNLPARVSYLGQHLGAAHIDCIRADRLPFLKDRNLSGLWHTRLRKIAGLSMRDWRVLAEVMATLVIIEVALRAVRPPRLLSWAMRALPGDGVEMSRESIERTAWLVRVGSRLTRQRCLTQSLTLARVLGRRGVTTQVQIGVRTEDGTLRAHAWVEYMGRPVNDDARSLEPFMPFDRALGDSSHA